MKANNTPKIINLRTVPTAAEILARVASPRCLRFSVTLDQLDELRAGMIAAGCVEVRELSKYGREWCDEIRAKLAGLVVPGVSELVDVFGVVVEDCGGGRYLFVVDSARPYLVIKNRAYFVPAWPQDKRGTTYRLLLPSETAEVDKIRDGWKYSEPEPQKIGKATAKKLAAWVEYLDRREEAAREYLDRGKTAAAQLFEKLDAAGAEYERNGNKVTIYNGPLSLVVELEQSGVYIGRPAVNLSRYYKIIRENFPGEDSALALMLNAKITL